MFRTEILSLRRDSLTGDVGIAVPIGWQSIGYLIFGGVAAAVIFLSVATYHRVETVTGTIAPSSGVSAITPTRNGVIAALSVKEGQLVEAGVGLGTIRSEEDSAAALSPAARIEAAVGRQDASLAAQMTAASAAANARIRQRQHSVGGVYCSAKDGRGVEGK